MTKLNPPSQALLVREKSSCCKHFEQEHTERTEKKNLFFLCALLFKQTNTVLLKLSLAEYIKIVIK